MTTQANRVKDLVTVIGLDSKGRMHVGGHLIECDNYLIASRELED